MDKLERWWSYLSHRCSHHQQDLHSDIQDAILPDDEPWNRWHRAADKWVEEQGSSYFDQCHAG